MDFLLGFLLQILSSVGVVFLFGSIVALLRRAFCAVAGKSGPKILLVTGIVGTPVHELSHALMCVIFGHKITEIKLYEPSAGDGSLGHVTHTYNKKNIYHQIGNFFIGIAPVVFGSAFIFLFLAIFLPDAYGNIAAEMDSIMILDLGSVPVGEFFRFIWVTVVSIFSPENFSAWQGWVFIALAFMIASHTELSTSDIKSGSRGLLFVLILLLLVDVFLYFVLPDAFISLTAATSSFSLILSSIMSISVIFLLLLLIIAYIIKGISMIFTR